MLQNCINLRFRHSMTPLRGAIERLNPRSMRFEACCGRQNAAPQLLLKNAYVIYVISGQSRQTRLTGSRQSRQTCQTREMGTHWIWVSVPSVSSNSSVSSSSSFRFSVSSVSWASSVPSNWILTSLTDWRERDRACHLPSRLFCYCLLSLYVESSKTTTQDEDDVDIVAKLWSIFFFSFFTLLHYHSN